MFNKLWDGSPAMKNAICLLVVFVSYSSAIAQSSQPMVGRFDSFSVMVEVSRNEDLRKKFAITNDMNKEISEFLRIKENAKIGIDILEIQRFGPRPELPIEKLAELDLKLLERLRQTFPNLPTERIRDWVIKSLYRTPESCFLNPKLHQYLNLDPATVARLNATANTTKPLDELRMKMREDRAKQIVLAFPSAAQVLFARYAGSTLMGDFEVVAEKDGPLEFECEAANSASMILYLLRDGGFKKDFDYQGTN